MKVFTRGSVIGAILLTFFSINSFSQGVSVGGKIGVTRSEFKGRASEDQTGISTGAGVLFRCHKHLGLSADLLYTEKGYEWSSLITDGTISERWENSTTLKYTELPIQAMWLFGNDSSRFRPKLGAGGVVSYLVVADQTTKYRFVDMEEVVVGEATTTYDVTANYQGFDLGAVASTGFNYRICHSTELTADARYTWGFKNIGNGDSEAKNRNWSFLLGVSYIIGK